MTLGDHPGWVQWVASLSPDDAEGLGCIFILTVVVVVVTIVAMAIALLHG